MALHVFFALKPISISDDKKTMKSRFLWLPYRPPTSKEYPTTRPELNGGLSYTGDKIKLWNCDTDRKISSGETITLRTDGPERRLLLSWDLLKMQWFLQRLITLSGDYMQGEEESETISDD